MSAWTLPLTAVNVTLTPPGGTARTINTTSPTALEAGTLSAVERLEVAWSRPTPAAHDDPHETTLILRASPTAGAAIVYDTKVDVTIAAGGSPWPILRGWITEVDSENLPNGLRRYTCRVRNIIARSQSARITATSWPRDNVGGRQAAIRAAAPEIPGEVLIHNSQYVRPRSVDAVSVLELHELTAPAAGTWVTEADGGIRYAKTPRGTTLSWQPDGTSLIVTAVPDGAVIHTLSADHIEAQPLTLTASHIVSSARVGYYTAIGEASSISRTPTPRGLPGSTWAVDTDIDDTAPARGLADLVTLADAILAASQTPIWTLPPTRLAVGLMPDPQAFTAIGTRAAIIIQIAGAQDTRVDEVYNLIGARFRIEAGELRDYQATLQPTRLVGSSPVQYDAAIFGTQYETITFNQLGTVRFDQTTAVFQGGTVL